MPRRNRNQVDHSREDRAEPIKGNPTQIKLRPEGLRNLGRQVLVVAAVVILVMVMMNLNSRLGEYYRLSSERDTLSARVAELRVTHQVLETQLAYSQSDQAAEDYAREAHMLRDGEKLVVPLTPAGNPTPTPVTETATPRAPLNWEVWWALFFDK
jgi:cell division protein FtsB